MTSSVPFYRARRTGKLYDAKGLYILVTPTGGKLWRLKYYFPQRTSRQQGETSRFGELSRGVIRARPVNVVTPPRHDVANGIDPTLRRTCEKICQGQHIPGAVASGVLRSPACREYQRRRSVSGRGAS